MEKIQLNKQTKENTIENTMEQTICTGKKLKKTHRLNHTYCFELQEGNKINLSPIL